MARTKKTTEEKSNKPTIKQLMKMVSEVIKDGSFFKKKGIEVYGLPKMSDEVKRSVLNINSRQELRILVDQYYQSQGYRIATDGQIRSINQEYDDYDDEIDYAEHASVLTWVGANSRNQEEQLKKVLEEYVESIPLGRWLTANMGIGPVIAAGLLAYFDISKCNHVNQFNSYAGLNDNNVPWLGKTKAAEIVKAAMEENDVKLKMTSKVPDDVIISCARMANRKPASLFRNAIDQKKGIITRESLEKHLAKPPYNTSLKVLCYKIGESFIKVSNKPNSLYGRLYRERYAEEMIKNQNGEYAEQAAKALASKNYGHDTEAYKAYIQGKLPTSQIVRRASRWATKLFISHVFDAMYIDFYHKVPPVPYPIAHMGHVDIIEPEVPYADYLNCKDLIPRD